MARRQANAAHIESLGESMTSEESTMLNDNREAEHSQPEPEPEVKTAPETVKVEPEKQPELALEQHDDEEVIIDPADIDPQTGKAKKVNFGALHAERKKRQAAEERERDKDRQLATALGRFDTLRQLAEQTKPKTEGQPTEIPDINVDPVGHFQAKSANLERQFQDVNRWRESQEANATAMNNVQQLTRIAINHETEFSKKTPDYQEAAAHVRSMRDQELQHMGYSDPAIRQQIITEDALQIAAQALQNNMNAAEVVYNIAKARGYQAKAPAKPAAASEAKKLATVAEGQKQGSPLGEVGGSAPAETSVESLLKMSDADFAKATKGDNWRKLFA